MQEQSRDDSSPEWERLAAKLFPGKKIQAGSGILRTDKLSLYANYMEGLSQGKIAPTSADNSDEIFPPFISRQVEIGAKYDAGALAVTLWGRRVSSRSRTGACPGRRAAGSGSRRRSRRGKSRRARQALQSTCRPARCTPGCPRRCASGSPPPPTRTQRAARCTRSPRAFGPRPYP